MGEIEFSVIVPIYKVEKYIRKCLDSILSQKFRNFELLLIDDGSPDGCPIICDEYANKDNRVRVIHKKNGGLVSARNVGIEEAKGEYICFVDGDDWIHEELLYKVYEKAICKYNPDIIIFGIVKKYKNKDDVILTNLKEGNYPYSRMQSEVFPYMMYDAREPFCKGLIFPAACNKIYRRTLLMKHRCNNLNIRMGEDVAFVYESLLNSNSIYILNEVLYFYNQLNPDAMNQSYDPNRFQNNQMLFEYLDERISSENNTIKNQINALKAYWVIMAVFHEVKCHRKFKDASRHIREELKKTRLNKRVRYEGLPVKAKCFLLMINMNMIEVALFGAIVVNKGRNK